MCVCVCVSVHVWCVCQYDIEKKNKPQRRIRCACFSGGYRVIALHLILSELESLPEGKKRILVHERFIDNFTKHILQVFLSGCPFSSQQRENIKVSG